MRIYAVALNTYREAIRDKVLYVLLFFAVATILGSKALGYISIGQDLKIVVDISLAAISVFGALIAIVIGTSLVHKEVDKRTVYTLLSQPMQRYEFILGKYAGLAMLIATVTVCMGLVTAGYIVVLGGEISVVYWEAILLIYCKLLMVTALSVLVSSLASPILGAIVVFSCYVMLHATGILIDLPPQFDGTLIKGILENVYFVLPNLSHFDIWQEYANGVMVPESYIVWTFGYGLAYTAFLLYGATLAFQNRDV